MKKVIFITNIPNPYRIPLFNEIHTQFLDINIKLKLVFGAEGYKRRLFQLDLNEIKFEYEILNDHAHTFSEDGEKTIFLYRGLLKLLKREKPHAIIVAGFSSATLQVMFHKFLSRTPYIIYSGSIETKSRNTSWLRKIQRTLLIKNASAFVVYGTLAKKYLLNSGAAGNKVFIAMNTVDTTFFAEKTDAVRKAQEPNVSISSKKHFTYVGYLVPRKNVIHLLETIKLVAAERNDFCIDILGDGVSKEALEKYVADNDLQSHVIFHGFRQRHELPVYFAKSSGFLFQTGFDIWGLVLNEAMAAGLACLSSPNAGATTDLVKEGETGFVVDFNDRTYAASKINWLLDNSTEGKAIGIKAAKFIREEVNIVKAASGFKNAIECIWNPK